MIFGTKEKPVNMGKFIIPVLVKRNNTDYGRSYYIETRMYIDFLEAATDGFFYEKENIKYFRVLLNDKESFIPESDLVFLKEM